MFKGNWHPGITTAWGSGNSGNDVGSLSKGKQNGLDDIE
jgi:hypothetical protein